jgi:hypothetical protein
MSAFWWWILGGPLLSSTSNVPHPTPTTDNDVTTVGNLLSHHRCILRSAASSLSLPLTLADHQPKVRPGSWYFSKISF